MLVRHGQKKKGETRLYSNGHQQKKTQRNHAKSMDGKRSWSKTREKNNGEDIKRTAK